jgi:multicomponent Na+:H+ antiporter subunit C
MLESLAANYNYFVAFVLAMMGFYIVIVAINLIRKLIGMTLFQSAVLLFYISIAKVEGGQAPIVHDAAHQVTYSNPLPHVLMLTAIVVGVATLAVGLALAVRIKHAYGTIQEDEILRLDNGTEED